MQARTSQTSEHFEFIQFCFIRNVAAVVLSCMSMHASQTLRTEMPSENGRFIAELVHILRLCLTTLITTP